MSDWFWKKEQGGHDEAVWKIVISLLAFAIFSAFTYLVMSEVYNYQEKGYEGKGYEKHVDLYAFLLQSKSDCSKKSPGDSNDCHQVVDKVISRIVPARDLLAQEMVATATQGLLWVSGLQFIVGFLALVFLGWTVYQTRLILDVVFRDLFGTQRTAQIILARNWGDKRVPVIKFGADMGETRIRFYEAI